MKYLILILFIIPIAGHASFMSKVDALACEKNDRPTYHYKRLCDSTHSDCIEIKKGYNCKTHIAKIVNGIEVIVEDAVKKDAYDASQDTKAEDKADKKNRRSDAKALLTKLKAGTDLTKDELRQALIAALESMRN